MSDNHLSNRLSDEKSPYLLQHAGNPVNWYPWGQEAFDRAREEDKPVFLSIGYATCHWCHVMAHQSFEDPAIASMMNKAFINIKVDREERPDIDHTYMLVCQMLTGSGGWPLNIIMTPDKKPFYAATYIPKNGRHGRPGMHELIPWISELWENEREKVFRSSDEIAEAFKKSTQMEATNMVSPQVLDEALGQFEETFDKRYGGFGNKPKFPSPHNLAFLLRHWKRTGDEQALTMVDNTLTHMRLGGLFDQVGFGFHRYSTDARWLVPHFEKMLYDQAMLAMTYTEGWQATHKPLFKQTAEEILEYTLRDLQNDKGAFHSAEDADSEGVEGKFYTWSTQEIREALPSDDAELAIEIFNASKEGNYEDEASGRRTGKNILHFEKTVEKLASERDLQLQQLQQKVEHIRKKLLEARNKRTRPLLDDKVLTDWNGLMIAALAKAGSVLDNNYYVMQAERALKFILTHMLQEDHSLLHRYRDGETGINAHADDYAFLIWGLLELYEATFNPEHLEKALKLNKFFLQNFWDEENGGFFFTGRGSEELLGRKKEGYDGALPSGNSVAIMNLIRLGRITADTELEKKAESSICAFAREVEQAPTGFTQLLQAVPLLNEIGTFYEVVIAGNPGSEDTRKLIRALYAHFIPNKVVILNDGSEAVKKRIPYIQNQKMQYAKATAYVCQNYSCNQPVHEAEEMLRMLE